MRNRSPANSADSSPPVPARISRKTLRSSFGSFGSSIACSSPSSAPSRVSAARRSSLGVRRASAGRARARGRGEVRLRLAELAEARDDRIDLGVLARQRPVAVHVARRILGREQRVELREARAQLVELACAARVSRGRGRRDYAVERYARDRRARRKLRSATPEAARRRPDRVATARPGSAVGTVRRCARTARSARRARLRRRH